MNFILISFNFIDINMTDDLAQSQLVMLNAIYFKGDWENRFNSHKNMSFHISNTNSVPIEMMCRWGDYNYDTILDDAAKYVELPYKVL